MVAHSRASGAMAAKRKLFARAAVCTRGETPSVDTASASSSDGWCQNEHAGESLFNVKQVRCWPINSLSSQIALVEWGNISLKGVNDNKFDHIGCSFVDCFAECLSIVLGQRLHKSSLNSQNESLEHHPGSSVHVHGTFHSKNENNGIVHANTSYFHASLAQFTGATYRMFF